MTPSPGELERLSAPTHFARRKSQQQTKWGIPLDDEMTVVGLWKNVTCEECLATQNLQWMLEEGWVLR